MNELQLDTATKTTATKMLEYSCALRRNGEFWSTAMHNKKETYGVFCNTANRVAMIAGLAGILAFGAAKYTALVSSLIAGMVELW